MFVCIVSGRSLTDICWRVGINGLAYIGNHGLEMRWGWKTWVHPLAEKRRPALGRLLKRIEAETRRLSGILVEDKGVTGSIHFRRLDPALVELLRRIVTEEVARKDGAFRIAEGKRVLEIFPNIDWNKGEGIRKLRSWLPRETETLPIFIGDDRTDEDAFRSLGGDSITIHVGRGRKTQARFRLADVDQVWIFMAQFHSRRCSGTRAL
jgi:trehalose 6-phosphate phosphatase